MTYELLQQGPEVYLPVFLFSAVVTILIYGAFPIIFAKARNDLITKKKYTGLCFGINFIVMIAFSVLNGNVSNGAPYFLWTWVFSRCGLSILRSNDTLQDNDNPQNSSTYLVECKTCGYRDIDYFEACPKCGKYTKQYVPLTKSTPQASEKIHLPKEHNEPLVKSNQPCKECEKESIQQATIPPTTISSSAVSTTKDTPSSNKTIPNNLPKAVCKTQVKRSMIAIDVLSIILSFLAIIFLVLAMNLQDAKRNIYENANPTTLYFILIGIYIVYITFFAFLRQNSHPIAHHIVSFFPSLFAITTLMEGSLFSNSYILNLSSRPYINSELVGIFNSLWVLICFIILIINTIPLTTNLQARWRTSIRYREKCYKKVARMKEHMDNGIITEEEFIKNKQDILKNIDL